MTAENPISLMWLKEMKSDSDSDVLSRRYDKGALHADVQQALNIMQVLATGTPKDC